MKFDSAFEYTSMSGSEAKSIHISATLETSKGKGQGKPSIKARAFSVSFLLGSQFRGNWLSLSND